MDTRTDAHVNTTRPVDTASQPSTGSSAQEVQILDTGTGRRVGIAMALTHVDVLPLGMQWSEDGSGDQG